jgi:hypothetical protein
MLRKIFGPGERESNRKLEKYCIKGSFMICTDRHFFRIIKSMRPYMGGARDNLDS